MNLLRNLITVFTLFCACGIHAADEPTGVPAAGDPTAGDPAAGDPVVVRDGGVVLTREELTQLVELWSPAMQQAAAADAGDRLELINMALTNKKIAREFEAIDPATLEDPSAYWRHLFTVRNMNRKFVVDQYMANIHMPDMNKLAKERYETQKKKYAWVAEQRQASQILVQCFPTQCDRNEKRPVAQALLVQLENGADFAELAAEYNQDPASQETAGKLDRWFSLGMQDVDPHFVGGIFEATEVGGYAPLTESKYGFHIIRLDAIKPGYYKSYDEVKQAIALDLIKEYRELAAKEFDARFILTPDAQLDQQALEAIFAPYKEPEIQLPKEVPSPIELPLGQQDGG